LRLSDGRWVASEALVDSGASVSLFDGQIGRVMGLTIDRGQRIRPSGIGGTINAFLHRIRLKIGNEEFEAGVAFTASYRLPLNLLGRRAVFETFLVTFDERARRTILETR
jgi:predicted aspartyl protease